MNYSGVRSHGLNFVQATVNSTMRLPLLGVSGGGRTLSCGDVVEGSGPEGPGLPWSGGQEDLPEGRWAWRILAVAPHPLGEGRAQEVGN